MKVRRGFDGTDATGLLGKVRIALIVAVLVISAVMVDVPSAQAAMTDSQARAARYARHKAARQARYLRQLAARQARYLRHKRRALKTGWKTAKVSWFGPGLYGSGLAGGGTLKKNSMICAHKTLPFGTRVEFSYKGKTVTVPVQDRGPYVKGREFDLGPGTARALGFDGVATVRYRILG